MKLIKAMAAILLLLTAGSVMSATPQETLNSRLNDVWKQIDFQKVRFPESLQTFEERASALLKHFRERPAIETERPWILNRPRQFHQDYADNALKHQLVGHASYPPQFRGKDTLDWVTNPFPDEQWIITLNRHLWMPSLAFIYQDTKEEKYAAEWCFEINSWVNTAHSPEQFRKFPIWSHGLDLASRMSFWPYAFERFRKSASFDAETLINYLWSTLIHMEQLDGYTKSALPMRAPSNHALHWQVGLDAAITFFPEFKNQQLRQKRSVEWYAAIQQKMVNSEGVILDFSPHYNTGYPESFLKPYRQAKGTETQKLFPQSYLDRIESGINAVLYWSHPTGQQPVFGDAWDLPNGAVQRYVRGFLKDFPHRDDWKYYASSGKEGAPSPQRLIALPESGIYSMRSDWTQNALFAVIRNQNIDARDIWHAHIDNLSFELSAYGERLMIDSGAYNYGGAEDWREWFRRPEAHQVVSLDHQPIDGKGKLLFQSASDDLDVTCLVNQVNPELTHRRTFFLVDKKYFVILDELSGAASGKLRQHFQFIEGDAAVNPHDLTAKTLRNGVNLLVASREDAKVSLAPEEGWISRSYMKKAPRPAFAFQQEKAAGKEAVFLTLLAPTAPNNKIFLHELTFLRDGQPTQEKTGTIALRINRQWTYLIRFDLERGTSEVQKIHKPQDWLQYEKEILTTGKTAPPPFPAGK